MKQHRALLNNMKQQHDFGRRNKLMSSLALFVELGFFWVWLFCLIFFVCFVVLGFF